MVYIRIGMHEIAFGMVERRRRSTMAPLMTLLLILMWLFGDSSVARQRRMHATDPPDKHRGCGIHVRTLMSASFSPRSAATSRALRSARREMPLGTSTAAPSSLPLSSCNAPRQPFQVTLALAHPTCRAGHVRLPW